MDTQTLSTILAVVQRLDTINVHGSGRDSMSLCINTLKKIINNSVASEEDSQGGVRVESVDIPMDELVKHKSVQVTPQKGVEMT